MRALSLKAAPPAPFGDVLAEALALRQRLAMPQAPLRLNAAGWRTAVATLGVTEAAVDALAAVIDRPTLQTAGAAVRAVAEGIAGRGPYASLTNPPRDGSRWRWLFDAPAAAELASIPATREAALGLAVRWALARDGSRLRDGVEDVEAADRQHRADTVRAEALEAALDAGEGALAPPWTISPAPAEWATRGFALITLRLPSGVQIQPGPGVGGRLVAYLLQHPDQLAPLRAAVGG